MIILFGNLIFPLGPGSGGVRVQRGLGEFWGQGL